MSCFAQLGTYPGSLPGKPSVLCPGSSCSNLRTAPVLPSPWPQPALSSSFFPCSPPPSGLTTVQPGLARLMTSTHTPVVLLSLGFFICQMGRRHQDVGKKHIRSLRNGSVCVRAISLPSGCLAMPGGSVCVGLFSLASPPLPRGQRSFPLYLLNSSRPSCLTPLLTPVGRGVKAFLLNNR